MTTGKTIAVGALTTLAGALLVAAFWYIPTIIASEHKESHSTDAQRFERLDKITQSNAIFIHGAVLERLYSRADSLRRAIAAAPNDAQAIAELRRTERDILLREKQFEAVAETVPVN